MCLCGFRRVPVVCQMMIYLCIVPCHIFLTVRVLGSSEVLTEMHVSPEAAAGGGRGSSLFPPNHAKSCGNHKACFYYINISGAGSGDRPRLFSSACPHVFPSFGSTIKYQLHFRLIQIWEFGARRSW